MRNLILFLLLSVGSVGWMFFSVFAFFGGSTASRVVSVGVFLVALAVAILVRRRNKSREMEEIAEMEEGLKR